MELNLFSRAFLFLIAVIFLPIHVDFIFSHIRRHHRKLILAIWVKRLSYLPILLIIGSGIWILTLDRDNLHLKYFEDEHMKAVMEIVEYYIDPALFSAIFLTAMYGAVIFYIGYGVSGLVVPLIIATGISVVEVVAAFADGFWQSIIVFFFALPIWVFAGNQYKKLRETRKYWRRDIDKKIEENFKP